MPPDEIEREFACAEFEASQEDMEEIVHVGLRAGVQCGHVAQKTDYSYFEGMRSRGTIQGPPWFVHLVCSVAECMPIERDLAYLSPLRRPENLRAAKPRRALAGALRAVFAHVPPAAWQTLDAFDGDYTSFNAAVIASLGWVRA
mgnify:CR=1 FL=1